MQQEVCINEVELPEQQTDDIILIDPDNLEYEDFPNDMTDEVGEDDFYESDDQCGDNENSNDESELCNLFSGINEFQTCIMHVCYV